MYRGSLASSYLACCSRCRWIYTAQFPLARSNERWSSPVRAAASRRESWVACTLLTLGKYSGAASQGTQLPRGETGPNRTAADQVSEMRKPDSRKSGVRKEDTRRAKCAHFLCHFTATTHLACVTALRCLLLPRLELLSIREPASSLGVPLESEASHPLASHSLVY